jgi:uncharacterized membrane protein YhdT
MYCISACLLHEVKRGHICVPCDVNVSREIVALFFLVIMFYYVGVMMKDIYLSA